MKLVLKTKLLVRRHFCGHAHERSRMWIDHLFCNEQSSHTRSDIFCFVTHPSAAPHRVTVSCVPDCFSVAQEAVKLATSLFTFFPKYNSEDASWPHASAHIGKGRAVPRSQEEQPMDNLRYPEWQSPFR